MKQYGLGLLALALALVSNSASADICNRTDEIKEAIKVTTKKTCEETEAADLAAIRSLHISGKGTLTLKAGDFQGLSDLRIIGIYGNQKLTLGESLFDGLAQLKMLDLFSNGIESIPPKLFVGLSALEKLNLSRNNLETLPEGLFSNLPMLQNIDVNTNKLKTISPGTLNNLPALVSLNLADNKLETLKSSTFTGVPNLKYLHINGNLLTSIPSCALSGLPELTNLNLADNGITRVQDGQFAKLPSLQVLDLSRNELTSVPGDLISYFKKLYRLELAENKLNSFPEQIIENAMTKSLGTLSLEKNPLPQSVRTLLKAKLPNLELTFSYVPEVPDTTTFECNLRMHESDSTPWARNFNSRKLKVTLSINGGERNMKTEFVSMEDGVQVIVSELFTTDHYGKYDIGYLNYSYGDSQQWPSEDDYSGIPNLMEDAGLTREQITSVTALSYSFTDNMQSMGIIYTKENPTERVMYVGGEKGYCE